MTALTHDTCRDRVLDDLLDDDVRDHLSRCPTCASLAQRVEMVKAVAPTLASPAPPIGLADRVIDELRSAPPRPQRSALRRSLTRSAALAAAVILVVVAIVVPRINRDEGGLDNALLVSARATADRGTARIQIDGRAEVVVRASDAALPGPGTRDQLTRTRTLPRTVAVDFHGDGELSINEGVRATVASRRFSSSDPNGLDHATDEFVSTRDGAFSRTDEGPWHQVGSGAQAGPVGAVLLDAGACLEVLRAPKTRLVDRGQTTIRGDRVRHVSFAIPAEAYEVDAWLGEDGVLRRMTMASQGSFDQGTARMSWRAVTTLDFSRFGEQVDIRPPAQSEVTEPLPRPVGPMLFVHPFERGRTSLYLAD